MGMRIGDKGENRNKMRRPCVVMITYLDWRNMIELTLLEAPKKKRIKISRKIQDMNKANKPACRSKIGPHTQSNASGPETMNAWPCLQFPSHPACCHHRPSWALKKFSPQPLPGSLHSPLWFSEAPRA